MASRFKLHRPLPDAHFGGRLELPGAPGATTPIGASAADWIAAAEAEPKALPDSLAQANGLLLIQGLDAIKDEPGLLVRLSRLFGPEIENYRENLTPANRVHATVPEILVVSNLPPANQMPPNPPEPLLTPDGKFPTQFPQRRGWHTDQSFRRPPPDISLFYAAAPARRDQGQTLFANTALAYDALAPELKAQVATLEGLHCSPGFGRGRVAVLAGETPRALQPHEQPQRQPMVRRHPVTGRRALYMCEVGQMDFIDGPIVGMEKGPHGAGEKLLFELMAHITRHDFVYVHEWTQGDLVIWDNRCLVHAASWFDAAAEGRVMWRTTVSGNPDPTYAGESKSWIPRAAAARKAAGGGVGPT